MVKFDSPFTTVVCPVPNCGYAVDLSKEARGLVIHLHAAHEEESLKDILRLLVDAENIDELWPFELGICIQNLCLHESTKRGLTKLRRKRR